MSKDINVWVATGRVVRDAGQPKYLSSGSAVVDITVAFNRSVKRDGEWTEEGNFIDVTVFGKQAEAIAQYLRKGTQVAVSGELVQEKWQDKTTGANRSQIKCKADDVKLMGSRRDGGQSADAPQEAEAPQSDEPLPF